MQWNWYFKIYVYTYVFWVNGVFGFNFSIYLLIVYIINRNKTWLTFWRVESFSLWGLRCNQCSHRERKKTPEIHWLHLQNIHSKLGCLLSILFYRVIFSWIVIIRVVLFSLVIFYCSIHNYIDIILISYFW